MNWDDRYHQAMAQYYRNMTVNLLHRLIAEKTIQEPILFLNGVKALREAGYTADEVMSNIVLELGQGEIIGIPNLVRYYWIRPMRTSGIPIDGDVEFFFDYQPNNILAAWKHRLFDDSPLRKTIIGVTLDEFRTMANQLIFSHFQGVRPVINWEYMLQGSIEVRMPK